MIKEYIITVLGFPFLMESWFEVKKGKYKSVYESA